MIGVIDYIPRNFQGNPGIASLELLMIVPTARRKGMGMKIVRMVEEEILKNPEITTIKAGVQVNNSPAIAFWEKQGYSIIGGPELMPDQTIVFHLEKKIARD
jgi:ribosomal protein S18 acetylase RimI-like enzyme